VFFTVVAYTDTLPEYGSALLLLLYDNTDRDRRPPSSVFKFGSYVTTVIMYCYRGRGDSLCDPKTSAIASRYRYVLVRLFTSGPSSADSIIVPKCRAKDQVLS